MQLLGQLQVRGLGLPSSRAATAGLGVKRGHVPSPPVASFRLFQVEVENFVLRVAAEFSSRKEQLVFLINNYDMMLGVLMVTDASFLFPAQRIRFPHCSSSFVRAEFMLVLFSGFFS